MEGYGIKEVISEMLDKSVIDLTHEGHVSIPRRLLDEAAVLTGVVDPRQLEVPVTNTQV